MKFWIHMPFYLPDMERPYHELLRDTVEIVKAADELGFHGVVIPENNFNNYIVNPSSLQFIGLIAAQTTRLRILSGVLVLPNHNPLVLAGEAAAADHATAGRLEIGVARGGGTYSGDRLGYDGMRSKQMYDEALEIMQRAWTETDMTHDGEFWSFPETTVLPRPFQQPYPRLWVAAQTENGIRNAGRAGLNLITSPNYGNFAPHGDIEQAMRFYTEAKAETGAGGESMVLRHTWIDDTEDKAMEHIGEIYHHWSHYASGALVKPNVEGDDRFKVRDAASGWDRRQRVIEAGRMVPASIDIELDDIYERYDDPIVTDPEKAVARFKYYEELGVDNLACLVAMGAPAEEVIHSLTVMAKDVLPAFEDSREGM